MAGNEMAPVPAPRRSPSSTRTLHAGRLSPGWPLDAAVRMCDRALLLGVDLSGEDDVRLLVESLAAELGEGDDRAGGLQLGLGCGCIDEQERAG